MDRTNWQLGKNTINLLALSAAYKGMAIPLMWDFLTKDELGDAGKKGNSSDAQRRELMERFISLFTKE